MASYMLDSSIPHLDLYNFTEDVAENSQYVLTSPRSLEACSRYGIKPIELLPQSYNDFIEENDVFDYNRDVVDVMYKKSERERLKKLRLCREERERIIDEKQTKLSAIKRYPLDSDDESTDSMAFNNVEENQKTDSKWNLLSPGAEQTPRKARVEKPCILSYLETARTTPRLSQSSTSRNPRTYGESSNQLLNESLSKGHAFKQISGSESEDSAHCVDRSTYQVVKAKPTSSRVSSARPTSSRQNSSRKYSFIDDFTKDISNSMEKDFRLMSDKDRHIAEIMLSKAKNENLQKQFATSAELDRSYDIERKVGQSPRTSLTSKLNGKDKKIYDVQMRKELLEKQAQLQRELELNVKNSKWQREYEKQMTIKNQRQIEIRCNDRGKKKRQEKHLRQLSQDRQLRGDFAEEEYKEKLKKHKEKIQKELSSAPCFDLSTSGESRRSEHDALLADIEVKHQHAQEIFQQQMKKKELQRKMRKMKEEDRKQQREKRINVMNKDLQLWQNELVDFQDVNIKRAEQVVDKTNAGKSLKAHNKRLQKELDHAAIKAKLEQEEELRRNELQAIIDMKDKRSEIIQKEKEDFVKSGREAARASRAIRKGIKEQTVKSSFDRMVSEAEKIARIEKLGMRTTTPIAANKSRSSLSLG